MSDLVEIVAAARQAERARCVGLVQHFGGRLAVAENAIRSGESVEQAARQDAGQRATPTAPLGPLTGARSGFDDLSEHAWSAHRRRPKA
jgi:hypothetical protein